MSAGGDNGVIARVAGPQGQAAPTPFAGAAYTPVQQGPVYQPQYQQYQPQARMAQPQQQMPSYPSGLQAALMHMMQQYSRPAMRAPLQQGISPSSPLTYRPPMQTQNLSRVAPSVILQQRQAAEAQAAWDAAHPQPVYNSGGNDSPGGGDGGGDGGGE